MTQKASKARQTGAGAQDPTTESDEMMYELLKKNNSLKALAKVVTNIKIVLEKFIEVPFRSMSVM